MKNLFTLIAIISFFAATQLSAQTRYTRIGIMSFPKPESPVLPEGVSSESKWIVPPLFLESERRFLKFFTIGSELTFSRYGIDNAVYNVPTKARITSVGLELQGKVSIPIVDMFEVYGQYGIGYMHSFHTISTDMGSEVFNQNYGIGYITNTISVGGSVILGESIGLFVEAGMMKTKTAKTLNDIIEDTTADYGTHVPTSALGDMGNQRITGQSAYAKIGIVFQINR